MLGFSRRSFALWAEPGRANNTCMCFSFILKLRRYMSSARVQIPAVQISFLARTHGTHGRSLLPVSFARTTGRLARARKLTPTCNYPSIHWNGRSFRFTRKGAISRAEPFHKSQSHAIYRSNTAASKHGSNFPLIAEKEYKWAVAHWIVF